MRRVILYIMSAAILSLSLLSCNRIPKLSKEKEQSLVLVKAIQVGSSSGLSTSTYVGTAEASKSAVVLAGTAGTLVQLRVSEGRRVSSGETIASIESQTVNSSYSLAKSSLERAQDAYDRVSKVHQEGGVSDMKMVEVQTALNQAQAAMAAAQNSLDRCNVKAPFAGVVSEVSVQKGEEVNPASVLVRIVDVSSVEIHFPLPENEYKDVRPGDKAQVYIPALDKRTTATVKTKGVVASRLAHSYDCVLGNIRDASMLMPGMVCKVTMEKSAKESIVIPANSVMTDTQGRYVWIVKDEIVGKRYINVGGYWSDGIIVEGGLEEGESVIVEGCQKVSGGMKVQVSMIER